MMFYLSKIAWGLFQPSSLILILLAAGAGFALLGNSKRANRLFLGGALLYAICGFSPLSVWLLAPLEIRASATAAKVLDDAAGIIVLGGAMDGQSPLDAGTPHLNEAADRMTEAVRLANLYPSLPVIFSGGSANMFAAKNTETESELARRFFLGFNIVPPRLKLEDRSRNTRERGDDGEASETGARAEMDPHHFCFPHAQSEGSFRSAGLSNPGLAGGL